jgi:hypothetical protein
MRAAIATLFLATVLLPGCRTELFRPAVRPVDVRLSIELSSPDGSAASPISLTAVVRNAGAWTVYHTSGCGCSGIGFELQGPDETALYADPCVVGPLCPCGPEALPPGATLVSSLHFAGDVFRRPRPEEPGSGCTRENARSGEYTIIVRYWFSVKGENKRLEQRATLHWSGA